MSDPGAPPPYGQNPYEPQTGQHPYGPPVVQPAYGGYPVPYASWIRRVGGYVIDYIITSLTALPAIILLIVGGVVGAQDYETYTDAAGNTQTTGEWNDTGTPLLIIGGLLMLVPIAFYIWNYFIKQGRTGRTIGKGVVDIKLIAEATGQPIGAGPAFVRQICHILDGIFYIGYLWPLWDPKRQTFADKIMSTVVINEPKAPTIP